MTSISRIVLKDCNLHAVQARHHPGPSSRRVVSHLDAREGVSLPSNARISTATNRLWSPIVALAAPSPRSAKVLCNAAANASGDVPSRGVRTTYETIIETLTTLFPLWVILGTILGIYKPAAVTWLETDLFTLGLGFLMLSMGLTLTFDDFRRCLRNPWTVGVGFLAQYLIKPLLGFVIAMVLLCLFLVSTTHAVESETIGTFGNWSYSCVLLPWRSGLQCRNLHIKGKCGTFSPYDNVFNRWGHYHDTILTKLLAGQLVPVDAAGLALSTFQVVLVPTIVGVLANEFFPKLTSKISTVTPLIGVILTTLLCASPIGQVADVLKTQGAQLIFPVALLHAAAFALGYWMSRVSFGESTSRTISIECGMQSSALGFLLAQKHFTNPLVAVPSAVSVVCMALGGSALAVFWRNSPISADDKDDFKE